MFYSVNKAYQKSKFQKVFQEEEKIPRHELLIQKDNFS